MPAKEIEIDPLDRPVWGIVRIAKVINASPKRTEHLLNAGMLDADEFSAPRIVARCCCQAGSRRLCQRAGAPVQRQVNHEHAGQ
jgi:hypothetical protein